MMLTCHISILDYSFSVCHGGTVCDLVCALKLALLLGALRSSTTKMFLNPEIAMLNFRPKSRAKVLICNGHFPAHITRRNDR
jgi:hypothetical protein